MNPNIKSILRFRLNRVRVRVSGDREPHRNRRNALLLILFSAITNDGFNPAVTITMASLDKIPVSDVMPFIISQVLGGLVAVQLFKRVKN
jgi:hypothetical protein